MLQTFSYLFYPKKPKRYTEGQPYIIYLRITVAGQRAELSTGYEIDPQKWLTKASKMEGSSQEAKKINAHIDVLKSRIYEAHQALLRANKSITAETLKNQYTGVEEKPRMLVPIFQKHNDEMAALVPGEYALNTAKRFKTSLMLTKEFMKYKYNVSDIDIRDINHEFIADFDFYLRTVRSNNNNTTVKYIRNFRKIIGICISNGWLDKSPFVQYKGKVKVTDRVYLSEEELNEIQNKQFSNFRTQQVKDIFVFCCYTGLAYVDVKKMSYENIATGIDGEKWLFINRTKTNSASRVPLLPTALEILDRYKAHPQCLNQQRLLPVLSNQKMNSYLKEIADICKLEKELTFHIARHTFATTVTLNNDVPIETVSKMLGHRDIRTTQHYAKLLDKKVSHDMQLLRTKYSNKLEVVKGRETGS